MRCTINWRLACAIGPSFHCFICPHHEELLLTAGGLKMDITILDEESE